MSIGTYPSSVEVGLPLSVSQGGTGATTAATARTNLGLGTLATQDASAVAITGGTATLASLTTTGIITVGAGVSKANVAGDSAIAFYSALAAAGGTNRWFLYGIGNAASYLGGELTVQGRTGMGVAPAFSEQLSVAYDKTVFDGLCLRGTTNDAGGAYAVNFRNVAGTSVGSITTTASATAYNTTSDARLKSAIAALTGALDAIAALRPVRFRWNADDSQGHGFLAHELQATIPDAVTGLPDAVNDDGTIQPQQIDYSKLVPWLVSGMQALLAQVETLTARVAALEGEGA